MLLSKNKRDELRQSAEFNATNNVWNEMNLNHVNNVGAVMALVKNSKATTYEEWERYYLSTGAKRLEKLPTVTDNKEKYNLNRFNGRTEEELLEVAKKFAKGANLSVETAYNYVYCRVIDETWVGYEKELRVLERIQSLCRLYPNLTASGVNSYTDTNYAVDFEVRKNRKVVLGIQLKSTKYRDSHLAAVNDVKRINHIKNTKYTNDFGAQVLYLYYENDKIDNWIELMNTLDAITE